MEEKISDECQKINRTTQQLRKATAAAKRVVRSAPAAEAAEAAKELQETADGLRAIVSAVNRRYGKDSNSPAKGFVAGQLDLAVTQAERGLAEAERVYQPTLLECRTPPSSGRGASSAAAAGTAGGAQQLTQDFKMMPVKDTSAEVRQVADDVREVRELTRETNEMIRQQEAQLANAEGQVDESLNATERGRNELLQASKYKMSALAMTGAIVGGIVGGPVGALAGAKSAATIAACAVAGGATGAIATKKVTSMVQQQTNAMIADGEERKRLADN